MKSLHIFALEFHCMHILNEAKFCRVHQRFIYQDTRKTSDTRLPTLLCSKESVVSGGSTT